MSYALSGSTPVPVPTTNTDEVRSLSVGVTRLGVGYGSVPWLDANLIVRNVTPAQADDALTAARLTFSNNGTVDEARWTSGGFIHVRWRPNSEQPAVDYATRIRDQLLRASVNLVGPRSQIVMMRYRIDMPALRDDIYVYPVGPVPPPPAAPPGAPPDTVGVTPPSSLLSSPAIMGTAAVVAIGLVGTAIYVSRAPRVRKNRNRRRRSR